MSQAPEDQPLVNGPSPAPTRLAVVFISYSRRDVLFAETFVGVTRAFGLRAWWDKWSIQPGRNWRVEMTRNARDCDLMLVLWCRHSAHSEYVRHEYQQALSAHKPVVPVRLDRAALYPPLDPIEAIDIRWLARWVHESWKICAALGLTGSILLGLGFLIGWLARGV